MTGQVARFQADMRGLPVRFEGAATWSSARSPCPDPLPKTRPGSSAPGRARDLVRGRLAGTPLRQSLLLKNLSRIRLASLE